ncbi:MAG: hypothetical protein DRH89_02510 [Candidatus Cloacimonadota bacterium]|nr:MAG: hypothetical protein DRH89_02510 [Candidatus Cloacimonadota bacterium]
MVQKFIRIFGNRIILTSIIRSVHLAWIFIIMMAELRKYPQLKLKNIELIVNNYSLFFLIDFIY